jgi:hypothetical protein
MIYIKTVVILTRSISILDGNRGHMGVLLIR